jgi:hypothetical protein
MVPERHARPADAHGSRDASARDADAVLIWLSGEPTRDRGPYDAGP